MFTVFLDADIYQVAYQGITLVIRIIKYTVTLSFLSDINHVTTMYYCIYQTFALRMLAWLRR